MKSFVTAIILSIAIIYSGSIFSKKMQDITDALLKTNNELHLSLQSKDKAKSIEALNNATNEYNKHKVLFQATSDHEELLRIELELSAIYEFINENQFGDALAACSEIELLITHLPQNFKLKPENIL